MPIKSIVFPRTAIPFQLPCLGQCNHLSSTFTNWKLEVISEIPLSFCCIPKSPPYLIKLFLSVSLSSPFSQPSVYSYLNN